MNKTVANKIYIISERFKPLKRTSAERPNSWYKYFPDNKLNPIVITRNLGENTTQIIKENSCEIHRIYIIRDIQKCVESSKFPAIFKLLIIQFLNATILYTLNNPVLKAYITYISNLKPQKGDKFIITIGPFYMALLSVWLKRKYEAKVILDYRDAWSTNEFKKPYLNFIETFLKNVVYRYCEKKVLKNVRAVTCTSPYILNRILELYDGSLKSMVLENGYDFEFEEFYPNLNIKNELSIVYPGSILPSQDIYIFLTTLSRLSYKLKRNCEFLFLGTSQSRKMRKLLPSLNNEYFKLVFKPRVEYLESISLQRTYDFGFMCRYDGTKGIPSSKLYTFLALRQPVILYPSDEDIIESTLEICNLGIVPKDITELEEIITRLLDPRERNVLTSLKKGNNKVLQYSRRSQTQKLAEFIHEL
jgi:glycosyltransferase involved in cell wall biosynthesis